MIWAGTNLTKNGNGDIVFCTNATDYGYWFIYGDAVNACPEGWRLPTSAEYTDLAVGQLWTAPNKVIDGIYTSFQITTPPTAMKVVTKAVNGVAAGQVLYFPGAGYGTSTGPSTATGNNPSGYYWTSTEYNSTLVYEYRFDSTPLSSITSEYKTYAASVRCVRENK